MFGHIDQCSCSDCVSERLRSGQQPRPSHDAGQEEVEAVVSAATDSIGDDERTGDLQMRDLAERAKDGKSVHAWAVMAAAEEVEAQAAALRRRAEDMDKLAAFLRDAGKQAGVTAEESRAAEETP
jgi:hypothetical protein